MYRLRSKQSCLYLSSYDKYLTTQLGSTASSRLIMSRVNKKGEKRGRPRILILSPFFVQKSDKIIYFQIVGSGGRDRTYDQLINIQSGSVYFQRVMVYFITTLYNFDSLISLNLKETVWLRTKVYQQRLRFTKVYPSTKLMAQ